VKQDKRIKYERKREERRGSGERERERGEGEGERERARRGREVDEDMRRRRRRRRRRERVLEFLDANWEKLRHRVQKIFGSDRTQIAYEILSCSKKWTTRKTQVAVFAWQNL
jgi:hypothetical protein